MSEVSTPTRRPVGTWVTVASVAVLMVAAVMLFGPAVEELREEATRSQRGNVLSKVALAAAPDQADSWSPVWDGPGGAVPDYLADTPASLTLLVPTDRWAVTRAVASSIPNNNEVEPIVAPLPAGPCPDTSRTGTCWSQSASARFLDRDGHGSCRHSRSRGRSRRLRCRHRRLDS